MDNRLDYIGSFEDGTVEKMTALRAKFIALDTELRELVNPNESHSPSLGRTVALARTHLETASMYAIKSLCLKHEKRPE